MYCKHCGKQIEEDSVFCKFCGQHLVEHKDIEKEVQVENISAVEIQSEDIEPNEIQPEVNIEAMDNQDKTRNDKSENKKGVNLLKRYINITEILNILTVIITILTTAIVIYNFDEISTFTITIFIPVALLIEFTLIIKKYTKPKDTKPNNIDINKTIKVRSIIFAYLLLLSFISFIQSNSITPIIVLSLCGLILIGIQQILLHKLVLQNDEYIHKEKINKNYLKKIYIGIGAATGFILLFMGLKYAIDENYERRKQAYIKNYYGAVERAWDNFSNYFHYHLIGDGDYQNSSLIEYKQGINLLLSEIEEFLNFYEGYAKIANNKDLIEYNDSIDNRFSLANNLYVQACEKFTLFYDALDSSFNQKIDELKRYWRSIRK